MKASANPDSSYAISRLQLHRSFRGWLVAFLLAAANIGLASNNTINAVKAGQDTTIDGKTNPDGSVEYRDANAADQVGGISPNLSLGSSKSKSSSMQTSDTAAVSMPVATPAGRPPLSSTPAPRSKRWGM